MLASLYGGRVDGAVGLAGMESGVSLTAPVAKLILAETGDVVTAHAFLHHELAARTPAEVEDILEEGQFLPIALPLVLPAQAVQAEAAHARTALKPLPVVYDIALARLLGAAAEVGIVQLLVALSDLAVASLEMLGEGGEEGSGDVDGGVAALAGTADLLVEEQFEAEVLFEAGEAEVALVGAVGVATALMVLQLLQADLAPEVPAPAQSRGHSAQARSQLRHPCPLQVALFLHIVY